jgi:hypothetical protein
LNTNATEGGDALLPLLEKAAAQLNITLVYKAIEGSAEGVCKGGLIEIEEALDTPARCGVIAHELGHKLIHKNNREGTTRQQRELEAESVAYAVLAHFGMHPQSAVFSERVGLISSIDTQIGQRGCAGATRLTCSSRCLLAVINGSSRQSDSKPLHPELERRTLDSQTSCGSVRPRDHSIRVFQGTQDLIPLRLFQHLLKALMGGGFGAGDWRRTHIRGDFG